jgi:ABC-type multidrug transport system fused ATPase/permease subunit
MGRGLAVDDEADGWQRASARETLAWCAATTRPFRGQLVAGWVFVVVAVALNQVATPLVFAAALGRVARLSQQASPELWPTFGNLLILYAVLLLAGSAVWRLAGWCEWGGCLRSFSHAIHTTFEHLLRLGYRWHVDHPAGEVASTVSSGTWALADLIDNLSWHVLPVVLSVLFALAVLTVVAWPAALVVLVLVLAFSAVLVWRTGPVIEAGRAFAKAHATAEGTVADVVRNVTVSMAQAGEALEVERVAKLLDTTVRADLVARRTQTVTRSWMESTLSALSWLSLFVGIVLALRGDLSAGSVYLILFYAAQVAGQVQSIFEEVRGFSQRFARLAKLVAIVNTAPEVTDAPGCGELQVTNARVSFRDVHFSYAPEQPVLSGLSLVVEPGEHVGVVGPSGGGKSTLARLALRFMDVTSGSITVDGVDVRHVSQASLRRQISYVPQDPQMLHRSIADNVWYGQTGRPDLAAVEEACRAAHVHEFVCELPDGYDTIVGERGLKLSGGQRQRVAIAQAMLKGAPILILDEATSSLDSESERYVQSALWELMRSATALVVAHRLSTISQLDRIVVVDRGVIAEVGTHQELLDNGPAGIYRRLWTHQVGGFLPSDAEEDDEVPLVRLPA